MFGKRVIGSCRKLNTPRIISTMNSTIDGIGFRIAQAETLSCITAPLRLRRLSARTGTHRVAVAQEAARAWRRRGRRPRRRSSIWTKPSADRPVRTLARLDACPRPRPGPSRPRRRRSTARVGTATPGAARQLDRAAREGADAQGRRPFGSAMRTRAEAGRPVDLREHVADAALDRRGSGRPSPAAGAPSRMRTSWVSVTSPSSSISPFAMIRNSGSPAAVAVAPMRAVLRLTMPALRRLDLGAGEADLDLLPLGLSASAARPPPCRSPSRAAAEPPFGRARRGDALLELHLGGVAALA